MGCRDCECDSFGVVNGDIVCDATSGQCKCKYTHAGRRCDRCAEGYFGFPYCQKCNCFAGGTSSVCDQNDGKCRCKVGRDGLLFALIFRAPFVEARLA